MTSRPSAESIAAANFALANNIEDITADDIFKSVSPCPSSELAAEPGYSMDRELGQIRSGRDHSSEAVS